MQRNVSPFNSIERFLMLFDDLLYNQSILLLQQVKLVQGNTALNSTLRRHSNLKKYLIQKQIDYLQTLEDDLPS